MISDPKVSGRVNILFLIISLAIAVSAYIAFGSPPENQPEGEGVELADNVTRDPKKSIQIDYLRSGTPQPTQPLSSPIPTSTAPTSPTEPTPTGNFCPKGEVADLNACTCTGVAVCRYADDSWCRLGAPFSDPSTPLTPASDDSICAAQFDQIKCKQFGFFCGHDYSCPTRCNQDYLQGRCQSTYCISKPVIYLYPEKPTLVDVRLIIPGEITVSDPLYANGWENVLAHPDGTLNYKGKTYPYLYYETDVDKPKLPERGIIIESNNLESELKSLTYQLGLVEHEQKDFLEYWISELEELRVPYILFQVIDPEVKEQIDHVEISPEPDTKIEFLINFKPLKGLINFKPLVLPERPERRGFTIVEWGGAIEKY